MSNDASPPVSWDPLGYRTELPWSCDLYPLGFHVLLSTNSEEVLSAASDCLAGCEKRFAEPPLQLRVIVSSEDSETDAADHGPPAPEYRAAGHLLVLGADARHFAACDLESGFASCWVTEREVRRRKWFQRYYLEGCCYAMLTHRSVTPVHASCVALGGVGALLCGRSGAGKSCLAYACARSGLQFVSDAASYLIRAGDDNRVMGLPQTLKLRPSAEKLFPELGGQSGGTNPQGESVIEIPVGRTDGMASANTCLARCVLFLERRDGCDIELRPIEPREAVDRLIEELPTFSEPVVRAHIASLEQLVRSGAYVLCYDDPRVAAEQIQRLLCAPLS